MKYRLFAFILLILSLNRVTYCNETTDSLFSVLDKAISNRENYEHIKFQHIETLTKFLHNAPNASYLDQDEIYSALFEEYSSFKYDSAFAYSLRLLKNAYQSKNKLLIDKSRIKLGFILLSSGLFKETIDTLNNVNDRELPDSLKREYYFLKARAYFDIADFTGDTYFAPLYNTKAEQMLELAIHSCDTTTKDYLSLNGLKYLRNGNVKNARYYYEKLLKTKHLDGHQYAVETSSLSFIYKADHEPELAVQMLIRAAIADIEASTRETVAIRNLAEFVYLQGKIKKAYTYVKLALDDAYFYGARHRKIQISDILPSIEDTQLEIVEHQRNNFLVYAISISFLSLITLLFGFIIFVQLRKLRKTKLSLSLANERLSHINNKLSEANLIKEEYIAYFFDTISEYIDRFEKMKVTISRKITTRQIDDIRDTIAIIDIKKERETFYRNFDSIFLKIFPDFMQEFNAFLKKETYAESETFLPSELRIYALIRLGFTDNNKIAKFLGYSLNTIYAYKTKVNNRLNIPTEEFEKKLMNIDFRGTESNS